MEIQRKKNLVTKISKKGVQKLQKWLFLTEKVSFSIKNTYKIETNYLRDLKLVLKQSPERPCFY